ncbi:MAG: hypothetical protein RLZZ214_2137, partial [Verrucomicrobiota bacterium]
DALGDVRLVTATTASLSGRIDSDGGAAITECGVVYAKVGINEDPLIGGAGVIQVAGTDPSIDFSVTAAGLTPVTEYCVRAYAINAVGLAYGPKFTFTTAPLGQVIFENTAGNTRALGYDGNGISPTLAFGYCITTGNEGFDLDSITLALTDFELATALRIRLFAVGADSLPAGPALATQDYASRSFGNTPAYFTFPLSGFRLKAGTSYILLVGASSGGASWKRYDPAINPQSSAGWTVNSTGYEASGSYQSLGNGSDRWSIQLTGTPFIASPPSVTLPVAGEIGATSATLAAAVSDDGGVGVTDFGFVYAPSTVAVLPVIDAVNVIRVAGIGSPADFAADVSGLAAVTEYSVRAYATNSAGTSYSEVGTFTTQPGVGRSHQQEWRFANFGSYASEASGEDAADPDHDGLSNLLEYSLGLNPNASGSLSASLALNGANLEYTYSRSTAAKDNGMSYQIEWSDTLEAGSWSRETVSEQITSTEGALETVKASIPAGDTGKHFLRLRVAAAGN